MTEILLYGLAAVGAGCVLGCGFMMVVVLAEVLRIERRKK